MVQRPMRESHAGLFGGRPGNAPLKAKAGLTPEPARTNPDATHTDRTIARAAAPPNPANADCSISIASTYTNSGTIKSAANADGSRAVSVSTTSIVGTITVHPV